MIEHHLRRGAVALPRPVQGAERFFFLRVDGQHWDTALASQAAQGGDVAKLSITLVRVDVTVDQLFTQRAVAKAGLMDQEIIVRWSSMPTYGER
jgi:hypothetical protein